ncbi:MAG: helix-turn-helix domain-containing protein [Afipia sp.]|nr:helix-turn-helix domain-containing protein [Afipia sp.]
MVLSIKDFCARNGICRSKVYQEIKAGRLKAVKVGRRTLILPEAEKEWRDSLPLSIPSPPLQPAFAGLMAA